MRQHSLAMQNSLRGLPSYHHISTKNVWKNCYTTISLWPPNNSGAKISALFTGFIICKKYLHIFWGGSQKNFILLFYFSTVLLFYCSTVLLFYCFTVLLFNCSTVLLFYCSTLLLLNVFYFCEWYTHARLSFPMAWFTK